MLILPTWIIPNCQSEVTKFRFGKRCAVVQYYLEQFTLELFFIMTPSFFVFSMFTQLCNLKKKAYLSHSPPYVPQIPPDLQTTTILLYVSKICLYFVFHSNGTMGTFCSLVSFSCVWLTLSYLLACLIIFCYRFDVFSNRTVAVIDVYALYPFLELVCC